MDMYVVIIMVIICSVVLLGFVISYKLNSIDNRIHMNHKYTVGTLHEIQIKIDAIRKNGEGHREHIDRLTRARADDIKETITRCTTAKTTEIDPIIIDYLDDTFMESAIKLKASKEIALIEEKRDRELVNWKMGCNE